MSRRTWAALAVGAVALAVAAGLALWETGAVTLPGRTATLADARPAEIDTVSLTGRRVEASVNGTVTEVGGPQDVRVEVGTGEVALRFEAAHGLGLEDRVLAVGRVRSRGGARVVEVASWSRIVGVARPPAAAGL